MVQVQPEAGDSTDKKALLGSFWKRRDVEEDGLIGN